MLLTLRYRFTRPKHAPRRVDPERERAQQELGRHISAARGAGAHIIVEDETDIRLFPVLRRMWLLVGEQLRLQSPLQNQKRAIFGGIDIETGEVFHRIFSRKHTLEMIAYLGDLLASYGGKPLLVILDHASIHKSRLLREWLSLHPQVKLLLAEGQRPAPEAEVAETAEASAHVEECPPSLEGLHILVLDDEEDTRDVVAAVLTKCGARVTPATSAVAALEALAAGGFDLIVSDIGLPGVDGYEFIRRVRARARGGREADAGCRADRLRAQG